MLPLMEGLQGDLLPADDHAAELLGVRPALLRLRGRTRAAASGRQSEPLAAREGSAYRPDLRQLPSPLPPLPLSTLPAPLFPPLPDEPRHRLDPDRGRPAEVWKMVMDPDRLGDWVTIHRRLRARRRRPAAGGLSDGPADPHARRQPRGSLEAGRVPSLRAGGVGGSRPGTLARSHASTSCAPSGTAARALTTATNSARRSDRSGRSSAARSWAACPSARRSAHSIACALTWRPVAAGRLV